MSGKIDPEEIGRRLRQELAGKERHEIKAKSIQFNTEINEELMRKLKRGSEEIRGIEEEMAEEQTKAREARTVIRRRVREELRK